MHAKVNLVQDFFYFLVVLIENSIYSKISNMIYFVKVLVVSGLFLQDKVLSQGKTKNVAVQVT